MSKNEVQKLIQFWGVVARLIKGKELTEEQAAVIIDLRVEVDCEIPVSTDDFTPAYIQALHCAYHSDERPGYEDLVDLVKAGFQDLVPYLRIPRARLVFYQLQKLIDPEGKDLFVHQIKAKYLDTNPDGCAVVTLVINDYRRFQQLLCQGHATPENIFFSDGAA